jgi:hypothetical protein
MKRVIGYVIFGVLIVGAVYVAVNRLSPFIAADEVSTPIVEAIASPTPMPHPTLAPSPTLEPSPIPPTIAPPPTLAPTSLPVMEVIIPSEIPVTATLPIETVVTAVALPTEILATVTLPGETENTGVLAPGEIPAIEVTTIPETAPSVATVVDAGIMPTGTPDVARQGGGGLASPNTGGQLSVGTPVIVPQPPDLLAAATLPVVEPTTLHMDVQPTLPGTLAPTLLAPPLPAPAQLMGTVLAPLSATLVLHYPDGTSVSGVTAVDGSFLFANLLPGTYRLQASADGFLSSQIEFTLSDGQTLALPAAALRGGDTNRDNVVDVRDAVLIAANFGGAPISPEIDLNRDGVVDIRDLTILGATFGESGPTTWG